MNRTGLQPGEAARLVDLVDYASGSLVSRVLGKTASGNLTVFAFDAGEEVSEHSTPCDAWALILDGSAELVVGGETVTAGAGEIVMLPAGVPHSLHAKQRFKMLLLMLRG